MPLLEESGPWTSAGLLQASRLSCPLQVLGQGPCHPAPNTVGHPRACSGQSKASRGCVVTLQPGPKPTGHYLVSRKCWDDLGRSMAPAVSAKTGWVSGGRQGRPSPKGHADDSLSFQPTGPHAPHLWHPNHITALPSKDAIPLKDYLL